MRDTDVSIRYPFCIPKGFVLDFIQFHISKHSNLNFGIYSGFVENIGVKIVEQRRPESEGRTLTIASMPTTRETSMFSQINIHRWHNVVVYGFSYQARKMSFTPILHEKSIIFCLIRVCGRGAVTLSIMALKEIKFRFSSENFCIRRVLPTRQ